MGVGLGLARALPRPLRRRAGRLRRGARERHYEDGPPADWNARYVSEYATAHPWEDWAETFAHYLHITDTIQTSAAYGIMVAGAEVIEDPEEQGLATIPLDSPSQLGSIEEIIAQWLPLSYALNAVQRSMGQGDLYPFILSRPVIDKLGFVHDLVRH